jgi:hypothetical protein
MQFQQLIYQSSATVAITAHQLELLLPTWRANNHALGISGVLLYGEEGIMQILEGEPSRVHALYQRIAQDVRHFNVHAVADGLVSQRAFGQWSMGSSIRPIFATWRATQVPLAPAACCPTSPSAGPNCWRSSRSLLCVSSSLCSHHYLPNARCAIAPRSGARFVAAKKRRQKVPRSGDRAPNRQFLAPLRGTNTFAIAFTTNRAPLRGALPRTLR